MVRLPSFSVCLCIIALFFAAGFAIYGQSLHSEFLSWDDNILITDNANVRDISPMTLRNIFTSYDPELYIPLTFFSYQIDNLIGGDSPFMVHVTNLLLHILNALLATWLLYVLLKRGWLALCLGAIFLLHPLNTEAVVWASARKDVLSAFFFLGSLLAWLQSQDSGSRRTYVLSLVLFVLGALSKVMVVTLPIILVLLSMVERKPVDRRFVLSMMPYFVVSVLFGVIGLFGKTTVLVASSTMQKILMACKAMVFYITKFFVPYDLSVMYPYTKVITLSSPDFYIPVLLVVVLLGIAWRLWRFSRLSSFGILFFIVTLAPTFINFTKGGDAYIASDRYAYIPMIGLLVVTGVSLRTWLEQSGGVRLVASRQRAFLIALCVVLGFFARFSFVQAARWKDNTTLYEYALSLYPNARAAHNNLGMELFSQGKYQDAMREFDRAIEIKYDPKTQANRAAALVALGRLDEALREFQASLDREPDLPDALYGIGNIYQKKGDLLRAAEQYRLTLAVAPDYTNALNNLGAVYVRLEDWDSAISTFKAAIAAKPDFVASYYNLAGSYEQKGMKKEAEDMYRAAIALHPEEPDALARLAALVYDRGDIDEAAQLLMAALELDASNPTAAALVLRMKKDGVAK